MLSGDHKPRTIVVTGGGSGIGRAVALLCAKQGDVAVLAKNGESARACADQAASNGANLAVGFLATSLMKPKSRKRSQRFQNNLGHLTEFLQTRE